MTNTKFIPFKRTLTAITVASFITACGSSSNDSNSTADTDEQQPTPSTQSISGVTADGYLVNAKVCLDINRNGTCEDDEPTATSEQEGKFNIENVAADIDASQYSIIVEVIAGETIDEDNPGVVIEKGYRLTAPEGVSDFISPISTLVSSTMNANDNLSLEEAKAAIEEKLGVSDTDVDIMKDYVAAKQTGDEAEEYERVHQVAQVVANVIANSIAESEEAGENDAENDLSRTEILNAIEEKVAEQVDEIVSAIDSSDQNDDFSATDIAEQVATTIEVGASDIQQLVELTRQEEAKIETSFLSVMNSGGIYTLEGHENFNYNGEFCEAERELVYQHITVADSAVNFSHFVMNPSGTFEATDETNEREALYWIEDQWQTAAEDFTVESEETDGSVIVSSTAEGRMQIWADQIPLTDKPTDTFLYGQDAWQNSVRADALFPQDSIGYKLSFKQLSSVSVLPLDDDCQINQDGSHNGFCNLVYTESTDTALTDYEQLLATGTEQNLIHFYHFEFFDLMVNLTGSLADGQGSATFFLVHSFDECSEDATGVASPCQQQEVIGEASWTMSAKGIELTLPSVARSYVEEDQVSPIFTLHDGFIRRAYQIDEGGYREDDWSFNQVALNALTSNVNSSALNEQVNSFYCGVNEEFDFDQFPEVIAEEPEAQKPEVINDEITASLLIGKTYYVEREDLQALITFNAEQGLSASVENDQTDNEEDGNSNDVPVSWVIDRTGHLLLGFDTEDNWVSIQLEMDEIGAESMLAKEQDGDELIEFTMQQVTTMSATDFIGSTGFTLDSQEEANCSVLFNLTMTSETATAAQGGGYVDLASCSSDDSITAFDFTWFTDNDAMVFDLYDSATPTPTRAMLFKLSNDQVVMSRVNSDQAGVTETEIELFNISIDFNE